MLDPKEADIDSKRGDLDAELLLPLHEQQNQDSFEVRCRRCKPSKRDRIAVIAIFIGVATAILIALLVAASHLSPRPKSIWRNDQFAANNISLHSILATKTNNKLHPCGTSSTEVRRLGCNFHQLTWSWLPPECPTYANGEFLEAGDKPYTFYSDIEGRHAVGDDEWEQVLNGELRVFAERREHVTHGVFMFLSLAQIVPDGTPFHDKSTEYAHMKHCAEMLGIVEKSPDWNDLDTLSGTVNFEQSC